MGKRGKAERVLIAQAVLVGGGVLALLLRELPGAIRDSGSCGWVGGARKSSWDLGKARAPLAGELLPLQS